MRIVPEIMMDWSFALELFLLFINEVYALSARAKR